MTRLVVLLLCAACGRVQFDPLTDAARCPLPVLDLGPPPTAAFGSVTLIAELASPAFDDDPTLTADELEIYFESARGGTAQLWRSVRASRNVAWPAPALVVELDGLQANTPEVSRDGLRLRFSSNGDVFLTTRPDRTSPWSTPVLVDELAGPDADSGAVEFAGGAGIVFGSNRAGGNPSGDLWEIVRDPTDCAFALPRLLAGLTSTTAKANPWVRDDGLVVVFPGAGSTGVSDLVFASRPDLASPFGAPIELGSLNSTNVDDDPWLDDAMTTIYFMSARTGDAAIYRAQR